MGHGCAIGGDRMNVPLLIIPHERAVTLHISTKDGGKSLPEIL